VHTRLILKIQSIHNRTDAETRKFVISPPPPPLDPTSTSWKNEAGLEAGYILGISLRLWQSMSNGPFFFWTCVFLLPFPLCPAKLIGDYFDKRQCAPNESISRIMGQYIGALKYPPWIGEAVRTRKKICELLTFLLFRWQILSASPINAGYFFRQYIGSEIPSAFF
jgi:hypothetical protein